MRAIKILAGTLAGLAALLIIGGILLVSSFDPNDYKGYATSYAEQQTGRTLTIADDLEFSFFPWLAIETGGVTIGNAEGFGDRPFATIAQVSARVKLMPLLSRQIEVGRVDIQGLELNLARDEQLRGNWEDVTARTSEAGAAGGVEDGGIENLDVEGVRIRDSTVNWSENRTDLRFVASGIALETGAIRPSEPVEIELAFALLDAVSQMRFELDARTVAELVEGNSAARDFSADFRVIGPEADERAAGNVTFARVAMTDAGEVTVAGAATRTRITNPARWPNGLELEVAWDNLGFDQQAQTLNIDGLATNAGGVRATWQIRGESLAEAPRLSGSVDAATDSVANALGLLAIGAPEGVDPNALGGALVTADFTAEPNELRMNATNVDARVLGMQIAGNAAVDANILRANVSIPRFAPGDALLALLENVLPQEIDPRGLGQMAFSSQIEADLDNNRAVLRGINAELLGGTLTGEVTATPGARGTSFSGALKTSRLPANAVAGLIGGYLPDNVEPAQIGVLAVDTRFNYNAEADSVTVNPFTAEAFGLNASGNATVTAASTAPAVAGEARLAAFSPRELLERFGQPVPQTSDGSALGRATVDARFNVNADRGTFENLVVALDESRITGSFTVSDFANPSYRFDLSADRIDVDRYLPPPADQAAAGERAAGDIELAPEPLNALRIQGRASVADLKLTNLRFQQVATNITIGGGEAKLDSARANLYGGEFAGAMHVSTKGPQPTMKLQGRAAGLQLEPLIEALVGDANFHGTGSFDIDLAGTGKTITDNLRSAAGSMGFALRDGAIEGFNLGHVLCSAYNVLQRLPAPPEQPKETRYQLIQANATVANGIATSPELLARAAFMDVTGGGRLVLAEQTLDYDLRAALTSPITIPNCNSMDRLIGGSIPFTIRGTVTEAEIRPDFGQIIQERVRDEVQDRIRDRLQDRLLDRLRE
jgi:uncharacterized protein involved in outer membrane biogenesis